MYFPGWLGFSRNTWKISLLLPSVFKAFFLNLETELDSIQVDGLRAVGVVKSHPEGINPYCFSLLQGFADVLSPDALDAKVLELDRHVLLVAGLPRHVHGAHSPLAALAANCCWAHQVVWMGLRLVPIMGDTGHNHNCRALVAINFDLGICLQLWCGVGSLEEKLDLMWLKNKHLKCPCSSALALVAES